MRESRTYGSVRGAFSNERPYRVRYSLLRRMSPQLADIVAKVRDYSPEAAAWISWNGSHHPLFGERGRCIKGH
jgi:hypothetical protein